MDNGLRPPAMYWDEWVEDTLAYYLSVTITYDQAEYAFIKKGVSSHRVLLWEDAIYSPRMFQDWLVRYSQTEREDSISFRFGNNIRMRWVLFDTIYGDYSSSLSASPITSDVSPFWSLADLPLSMIAGTCASAAKPNNQATAVNIVLSITNIGGVNAPPIIRRMDTPKQMKNAIQCALLTLNDCFNASPIVNQYRYSL